MQDQVKPEAFFDSLSLAHKLDNFLDGFQLQEIHLFAYFSSVLYLYRGKAVADWSYKFTLNSEGYPFSTDLYDALTRHIQNGWLEEGEIFFSITARGTDQYNNLKVLPTFSKREEFLNAACTTSILVPYSQTQRALLSDPEISKRKELHDKSWLEQSNIYQKFDEINKAVGVVTEDLIIPAVTWITYLSESKKSEN